MSRTVRAKRIDSSSADWPGQLREIRRQLGERPTLLPHHFLEAVLPKIGGACISLFRAGRGETSRPYGYAFLIPRHTGVDGATFTLRYESVDSSEGFDAEAVSKAVGEILTAEQKTRFYLPEGDHVFTPTHIDFDGVDCGRPNEKEATEIRRMQRSIWRSAS